MLTFCATGRLFTELHRMITLRTSGYSPSSAEMERSHFTWTKDGGQITSMVLKKGK